MFVLCQESDLYGQLFASLINLYSFLSFYLCLFQQQLSVTLETVVLTEEPKTEEIGPCPDVFSGEIISDRKSHFQPHLAAVESQAQVR